MDAVLIYNPGSGRKKSPARAKDFKQIWESEIGTELKLRPTRSLADISVAVKETYKEGILQIFMGGDGTISECLQVLFEEAHFEALSHPVAMLPGGSGDSFLRDFGIENYEQARDLLIKAVKSNEIINIDTAIIDYYEDFAHQTKQKRISFNIFGIGLIPEIAELAMKMRFLGKLNYTVATILILMKHKAFPVEMTVDSEDKKFQCNFVSISNSRFTGGAMEMAPPVRVNDGKLFMVVSQIMSKVAIFGLFPSIFKGKHITDPKLTSQFVKTVTFQSQQIFRWNVDGEMGEGYDPTVSVKANAFKLMMPLDSLK